MSIASAYDHEFNTGPGAEMLDLAALENAPLQQDPFDFVIVPDFIAPGDLAKINADYPDITKPGNFKLDGLQYGPAFEALISELRGAALRERIAAKFGVDLTGLTPTAVVRRFCEETDGHIHVDHRTKIITMILYFNEDWSSEGGQLRFLRSANDIEDYAAEITPVGGTMLAFRRSDRSFHGHKQFVGERRIVQLSWAQDGVIERCEKSLNRLSKPIRRFLNLS